MHRGLFVVIALSGLPAPSLAAESRKAPTYKVDQVLQLELDDDGVLAAFKGKPLQVGPVILSELRLDDVPSQEDLQSHKALQPRIQAVLQNAGLPGHPRIDVTVLLEVALENGTGQPLMRCSATSHVDFGSIEEMAACSTLDFVPPDRWLEAKQLHLMLTVRRQGSK